MTDSIAATSPELALHLEKEEPGWRKSPKMIRRGYHDLRYLPRERTAWNATMAALAFSQQRQRDGKGDLNRWAAMHGCAPGARYADLGDDAIVLWHGTSNQRAERIREVGLFSKRGLWTTLEPKIAHGYTRNRSTQYGAGSATIVLVLDRREIEDGVHYNRESPDIFRFHGRMGADRVEYIVWGDRLEFTGGAKAAEPRPWGRARFKRQGGKWVPLSRPPVRLDEDRTYSSFDEWLRLSIKRVVALQGKAMALEVFSSLYATLDPWEALEHEHILDVIEAECLVRQRPHGKELSLRNESA